MPSNNDGMPTFSENLKRLMLERRVTAKVISQATGIPTSTLSEWSAGRTPKLGDDIMKLARFFGTSIEYLITGKEVEASLIEELLHEDAFVTLHTGMYRIKVEKFTGPTKKKKE